MSTSEPGSAPEILVDARGLRCPLPVIEAAKAAASAPPGSRLRVLSTDPASEPDLTAWARLRRYTLVALTVEADLVTAIVDLTDE